MTELHGHPDARRPGDPGDTERLLEEVSGGAVVSFGTSSRGGSLGVAHRLPRTTRLFAVMGESRGLRCLRVALERLGGSQMHPSSLRAGGILARSLCGEWVPEAVEVVALLLERPRLQRLGQGSDRPCRRHAGHRRHQPFRHRHAKYAGGPSDEAGVLAERAHALANRLPDRWGHTGLLQFAGRPSARGKGEPVAVVQQAHDLLDGERHSRGPGPEAPGELLRNLRAPQGHTHKIPHLLVRERAQLYRRLRRLARRERGQSRQEGCGRSFVASVAKD